MFTLRSFSIAVLCLCSPGFVGCKAECPGGFVKQGKYCVRNGSVDAGASGADVANRAGAQASQAHGAATAGVAANVATAHAGSVSAEPIDASQRNSANASDWYCEPVANACSCVKNLGAGADTCTRPKPSCCFTVSIAGIENCQCWPPQSDPCTQLNSQLPDAVRVNQCPPD
jgi:hypothetical protein